MLAGREFFERRSRGPFSLHNTQPITGSQKQSCDSVLFLPYCSSVLLMNRLQQASIEQRACHIVDDIGNGLPGKVLWRNGGIAKLRSGHTIRRFRREKGYGFDGSCLQEVRRHLIQPVLLDRVANGPLAELAQTGDGKGAGRVRVSSREGIWPASVGKDGPASGEGRTQEVLLPPEMAYLDS